MSPPMSPKEAQTPRPVETEFIPNDEQTPHGESTSTPQSGDSHAVSQDGRKSVSSSSARSSGSLSTSYSSPDDDRSEVGELPDNQSMTKEQPVQVGKQSPGNGDGVSLGRVAMEGDGQVEKLEKQLADMDIQQEAGKEADDDDADSYLNDPLVKYTVQLHDYTKRLYIEARILHEKLQRDRTRGGRGGKSGIEAMGRKTAPPPRY